MAFRIFLMVLFLLLLWATGSILCIHFPSYSFPVIAFTSIAMAYILVGLAARDNAIVSKLGEWIAVGKQE